MNGAAAPWSLALAPAKVNPWLAVLGRRPDGYHALDTGLLALDLCDLVRVRAVRVRAREGTGLRLALSGPALSPDVTADERNLAWRAAAAVLAEARAAGACPPAVGLELELDKRIPSRAGLGGGSADAVAAALAARAALGLAPAWAGLAPLAAALGSDTAFFALAGASGFARCTGRGERVEPLPAVEPGRFAVALITPALEAPTAAVFAAFDSSLPRASRVPKVPRSFLDRPVDSIRALLFNDLEPAALATIPGLSAWRGLLDRCGASHFRLSGSGSSFFGLFEGAESASRCLTEITALAQARGLAVRGAWVTHPAGHGAVLSA